MGFNVIVIGSESSRAAERFSFLCEELPWNLLQSDQLLNPDSGEACAHFYGKNRPSAVVCFMSSQATSKDTLSALAQLIPYCSQSGVPIILISSYLALGNVKAQEEYSDTTLVSRESNPAFEENDYTVAERLVSGLDKHIILRTSWIIDDAEPCLFSTFLPLIESGSEFTVSDVHYGRPIAAASIGDVLIAIIQQILTDAQNWGLYHLQSSDKCSEAEFCDQLVRHAGKITKKTFVEPTVAAANSNEHFLNGAANLSGRKLTDDFGIQLASWRKGFGALLEGWLTHSAEVENAS